MVKYLLCHNKEQPPRLFFLYKYRKRKKSIRFKVFFANFDKIWYNLYEFARGIRDG